MLRAFPGTSTAFPAPGPCRYLRYTWHVRGTQQCKYSFKRSPERHRPRWLPLLRAPDLSSTTAWLGLLPSWKPALDKPKPSKIPGSCLASLGADTPVPNQLENREKNELVKTTGEKVGKGGSPLLIFCKIQRFDENLSIVWLGLAFSSACCFQLGNAPAPLTGEKVHSQVPSAAGWGKLEQKLGEKNPFFPFLVENLHIFSSSTQPCVQSLFCSPRA